jgi:phosphopantetheinyl transferase (holo-ACP synthase)
MKIYGIGTDIVSIIRIKKLINKKIFLKRLFGKEEVARCSKLKPP